MNEDKKWHVYIVICQDDSLYCGITPDIEKRIESHNTGDGAKWIVPRRRPVVVVYATVPMDRGSALREEYAIKQLPRWQKHLRCRAWVRENYGRESPLLDRLQGGYKYAKKG